MTADLIDAGIEPNGAVGADAGKVLAGAGAGDLEQLRALSSHWFNQLYNADKAAPDAGFLAGSAVMICRLAASHRHAEDVARLAGALCLSSTAFALAGRTDLAALCDAECMNLCDHLAEHGHEGGAIAGNQMLEGTTPELLQLVREYRTMTKRTEETA
jgi:hypothetical protein